MYRDHFMRRAVEISRQALDLPGTEPFGCVIVKDGAIVGEGLNHSRAHFDPTSHGEVEAIRDACRRLECVDLTGCELYTSCEPCAMCVATMEVAGISKLYYAASMAQAGIAFASLTASERHPIDVDAVRAAAGARIEDRAMPSQQAMDADAVAILDSWVKARKAATASGG
ncbi:tRNA(Arg) A34 adenosine deaminase TadA [Angulomicrobium tetraedrale]|uniref:tRNA(Arg) A34 adenosine deaminase TadA n=1 Tax=Ancylobacter tetraedralis TaxID=217068 RepID=A0A839ZBB8_9HYPH|nr:nucleoside deaminase [Ancylobacter tetraedralis]MBB3771992.1 tRNA(Arg) A34 adenosine deaminase TadA [Ancylobacter tetraedralis]